MINAAPDNLMVDRRPAASAYQAWGSAILIVVAAVWTLAMVFSLREKFLDRFIVGTSQGAIGVDFFQAPRGFRNLISGSNIYLTEMDDYGPYASMFFNHPMVAVAVGPWTVPLAPWTAYGVFVGVSLVLLAMSAAAIACQLEGGLLRAFAVFAIFCSLPTYLMLWSGQMHVVLVLAVAMMLGGLVGMAHDEQGSTRSLRMLQIGLLISLLSKPAAVLALPVLFATRETRRALIVPVAAYAAISVLFLLTPALNAGGYDGIHWLNLVNASSSPYPMYSLVFPRRLDLVNTADVYCLPTYLLRLTGAPVPAVLLKLPVLAILAMSAFPLFLASRRRRIDVLITTLMLCLLSHFLSYYTVFEYHYTTLLPMLPVLCWMSQREERAELRVLLRIAFVVLLVNFVPSFYFLAPETPMRYAAASTLLRVVPVVIAFVCLLLYGAGAWWAAWREGSGGVELPRGQLSELTRTGAALTISCAAVLASVLFSAPHRLTKPLEQWTTADWLTHIEDLLARRGPGLKPADVAAMHLFLGGRCFETDEPAAREHYAAAVELVSGNADHLCELGDRILDNGQVDVAISVYQRVLQLNPHHRAARARLRRLQDGSS